MLLIWGAHAANQTWSGGSTANGDWSTTANWVGGAAPGATSGTTNTDIATFDSAIANTWGDLGAPVVITSGLNIGGINFSGADLGNYYIGSTGGNSLQLTSGGTIQILSTLTATNAIETINAPLKIEGANGYDILANYSANGTGAGAGTLNFGGGITGGAAGTTTLTLSGTNTNANTISGIIANGSATHLGVEANSYNTGTWVLSGANTYTGVTEIDGGILNSTTLTNVNTASGIGKGSAAGSAADLIFGGGTLQYTAAAPASTNRLFTIGDEFGSAFTATIDSSASAPADTLSFTGTGAIAFYTGGAGALTLTGTNTGANTFAPVLGDGAGGSDFTKSGAGTWILSGHNTYTGPTTVSAGTLEAGVASVANTSGAFGDNSAVIMANVSGAILSITGFNTQIGSLTGGGSTGGNVTLGAATLTVGGDNTSPPAYAGVISGTGGSLAKIGTGTLSLSGANTYTGGTTVSAGALSWLDPSAQPPTGTTTVASGATLGLGVATSGSFFTSANVDSLFAGTLANVSNSATSNVGIDTTAGNFTYASNVPSTTRGLTKLGANTLFLSGTNTYTGGTTVSAGTLDWLNTSAEPPTGATTVAAGAALALAVGTSAGYFTSANVNSLFAGTLTNVSNAAYSGIGIDTTAGNFAYATSQSNSSYFLEKLGANTLTYTGSYSSGLSSASLGVTVFAGTLALTGNGYIAIENAAVTVDGPAVSAAQMTMSSGAGTLLYANYYYIGYSGVGSFTQSGGTNGYGGGFLYLGYNSGSTGSYTLSGGTLSVEFQKVGNAGAGSFTQSSGTNDADTLGLGGVGGGNGTYMLSGGALRTTFVAGGLGTSTFDFNGGTLQAFTNDSAFVSGLTAANVQAGGATIDTQSFTVTIPQPLIHDSALGGTADGGLTKIGSGTLTLSGANTYTGPTTVSAGTLFAGAASVANTSGAFGNNSALIMANVSGAILNITGFNTQIGSLTGGGSTGGDVTLGAATLTVGGDNTSPAAYAGVISGTGGSLAKIGTGTLSLSGANTYTGGTTVSAGTLDYLNTSAEPAAGTTTVAAGATLGLGVATSGSFFTSANVDSLFAGTLANVSNSATSNVGIDTTAGNFTYASNVPSTTRGLTKLGANTLTLTGSDSYTGATSVNAGTLIVSGSISGSTTTVANTAILTGSGTTGPVIVDSSGTLEPENAAGTAVGTLDTGALTLNGAATFALKLDTAAGTASKDIDSGGLSLASGDTAVLSLTDFGTSTALANGKVFAFIDYSGTWNGNTFSGYANLSTFTYGANTYEINYAGVDPSNSSTAVTLMVMVPEPGCGALLGLGAAVGLLALRRRRGGAGSPRR